mmetsp:Transcript_99834/g.291273  ORF Transcript_99834/g.291273 Transcript_99834/m.291273 type:complete len:439 (+) Transcript_99834:79-1395(+)
MMAAMPAFILTVFVFPAASAHAAIGWNTTSTAGGSEVLVDSVSLLQSSRSQVSGRLRERSSLKHRSSDAASVAGYQANLVNTIISKMKSLPGNQIVLQSACQILQFAAATGTDLQEVMVGLGAQELAISAMQRFPQQWQLQVACSSMLSASVQWKEPLARHGGDAGAIEVMMAAIKRFPEVPEVRGIFAQVGAFCDFVQENRQRVNRAGGVELALQSARDYYDAGTETSIQCFFSTQCPTPAENTAAMVTGGYIPFSVQVMRDFPQAPARGEVLWVLNMCFDRDTTHLAAMVDAGIIKETIKVLNDGSAAGTFADIDPISSDTRIGNAGMSLLGSLVRENVTVRNMAVDAGAIEAIASVLLAFGDQSEHMPFGGELDILPTACMTLTSLVGASAASVARPVFDGLVAKMASCLSQRSPSDPARVAWEALMLMRNPLEH